MIDSRLAGNSYPSGHATVVVEHRPRLRSLIAPPRLRTPVGPSGAASVAAAAGVFVVTADWHRPSDAIGSYLLTLAVDRGPAGRCSGSRLPARRDP